MKPRRVLDLVAAWADRWGCRRRAYLDVLVVRAPRHVLGPCMPGEAAADWAWGGGEFFTGSVERFLAWAAGTHVNVKAVGDSRVYAGRSVPNRHRRVSPVSVLAALMFRGAVTREYLWGPVLPSWYVERYWDRPYGTVPRESVRALARYVTRIPEQLRDLLDVLKIREWETVKEIAGT